VTSAGRSLVGAQVGARGEFVADAAAVTMILMLMRLTRPSVNCRVRLLE
jgi:hypothetical protein